MKPSEGSGKASSGDLSYRLSSSPERHYDYVVYEDVREFSYESFRYLMEQASEAARRMQESQALSVGFLNSLQKASEEAAESIQNLSIDIGGVARILSDFGNVKPLEKGSKTKRRKGPPDPVKGWEFRNLLTDKGCFLGFSNSTFRPIKIPKKEG